MQIPYVIDNQIYPDARAIKAALTGDLSRKPFTEENVLSAPTAGIVA